MNKGIAIRNTKRRKNAIKRNTLKEGQENLCRFVTIRYEDIQRVNGKYRRVGNKTVNGLQIQNKVYLLNGGYKLINSKSVKLIKSYGYEIPDWATEELIEKRNKFTNKSE